MTAVLGAGAGPAGAPHPCHVPLLIGGVAARGRRVFEVRDPGVGQQIMAAAAANLKKVSLEPDAELVAVEQFGPVLPVVPYRDEDEAVAFANLSSLSFGRPFGGVKRSGLGRERTALGLREYVEEHAIRLVK
jgi:acyl-CoA reductase-like NAD-dependent aldehyde dehydrogenase